MVKTPRQGLCRRVFAQIGCHLSQWVYSSVLQIPATMPSPTPQAALIKHCLRLPVRG